MSFIDPVDSAALRGMLVYFGLRGTIGRGLLPGPFQEALDVILGYET